jgi:hypothetical protein
VFTIIIDDHARTQLCEPEQFYTYSEKYVDFLKIKDPLLYQSLFVYVYYIHFCGQLNSSVCISTAVFSVRPERIIALQVLIIITDPMTDYNLS